MKILFLLLILTFIIIIQPLGQIAFSQVKFIEFENKNYDIKIEYPQSWNIREGDIEPGDFKTEIAIFEPSLGSDLDSDNDNNCEEVCIALYIDNSPRQGNLFIETYVDQIINSLKDDLDKFEVIYYDTTNTQIDDHKAYKLVYEEENNDKKYMTIQRGVIYDNQVYIVEYKANEKYYEKYLPIAEEIIGSLKLPEK
jgi:serine/threonine-protein kinase